MSKVQNRSLDEIVESDGEFVCPKCIHHTAFDTMDAWMYHVDDMHEPVREWVRRWTNPDSSGGGV